MIVTAGIAGCASDFDTSRMPPPRGTLGREIFTVICDRVAAQALREDISGASYHAVCHADADGAFVDQVERAKLPPLDPAAKTTAGEPVGLERQETLRAHRIARIEALARRRSDLVEAFDAALEDETIAGDHRLQPELAAMVGRLADLYADDTIPHVTRALARTASTIAASPSAQTALARLEARRGYRPEDLATGVARPLFGYPALGRAGRTLLGPLADGGSAHPALVSLLAVAREEMRSAKASPPPPTLTTTREADTGLVRLSRPRESLELSRAILLASDPAFSVGPPRLIVARDPRGLARVRSAGGTLPAPFVDVEPRGAPDGLADVDDLGRFRTKSGVAAPLPFPAFRQRPAGIDDAAAGPSARRAASGIALADGGDALFETIDVDATFLASLSRDVATMLEPDVARERETLMDFLAGFYVAAGARDEGLASTRDYAGRPLAYRAYRKDASPLLDLVHAIGQVLAMPESEDALALLETLSKEEPDFLPRLVGIGLRIKAIADAHPEAVLPATSTLWDDLLDVLAAVAAKPRLVEDILSAFGDPATVDLPRSASAYLSTRDELTYDRTNLNGPPRNMTTGKVEPPKTLVDRRLPDTGANRSAFQRFLQALHDTNGLSVCTKEGAVAHIVWNGLAMDFPSFTAQAACFTLGMDPPPSRMPACGMLRLQNVAAELIDALLGTITLDIRDPCLRALVSSPLTGIVGGSAAFLQEVTGIEGFTLVPTVPAISRMVYFDLPHDGQPGDLLNLKTHNFFRDIFDPAPSLVCPPAPFTDTDGTALNLRTCARFADTIRGRDPNALFPLEHLGFLDAAKPLARAFRDNDEKLLFVRLFDVLHLHWGSKAQSRDECDPTAPRSDARFCTQDGAVTYEPLLAEALRTDLFPILAASSRKLAATELTRCTARNPNGACAATAKTNGLRVLAEFLAAVFDPARAKGVARRDGDRGAVRNDGGRIAQVTPALLLVDALKGIDGRFEANGGAAPDDRLLRWRRARSRIVDRLFAVDESATKASWQNRGVGAALPVAIATVRAQRAARCDDRSAPCDWARRDLATKAERVVTGPLFATILDLLEAIRADEGARTELEAILHHLLTARDGDAGATTRAALVDLLQVFDDDVNVTELLHAFADAVDPAAAGEVAPGPGLVVAMIELLSRVTRAPSGAGTAADDGAKTRAIDPHDVLPAVLRKLFTPGPAPNDGTTRRPPPIDVLLDVFADVNRRAPELETKLVPDDYASIGSELADFCVHPSRGLEQVYEVLRQATRER